MSEPSPPLVRREEDFIDSGEHFGILLTRVSGAGNLHSGVVFRRRSGFGRVGYLHAKWDNRVGERWGEPGVWTTPNNGSRDLADRMAAAAELTDQIRRALRRRGRRGFPYGIGWGGATFEPGDDGLPALKLSEGTLGLTCATLPLAILKSVQLELIDISTWLPRPEQDQELVKIARRLGHSHLVARFEQEIAEGVCRVRPEEVVGASCCQDLPASFTDAVEAGRAAVSILDAEPRDRIATAVRIDPA